MLVVLHIPAFSASSLPAILDRVGPLTADHARDHEPLVAGRIYVAPPDFHLLAELDEVRLTRGPLEQNHRPAIDPLFRSVALAFGPAAIALVLTGALADGAAGVIGRRRPGGGTVVVQDPNDAPYAGMPSNALAAEPAAHVAPLADIPGARRPAGPRARVDLRRRSDDPVIPSSSRCSSSFETARGFDYTGYKRPTLIRRFQKRMDAVGVDGYAAYREHLDGEPGRVRRALRHDPDQRHRLLPRPGGVGVRRRPTSCRASSIELDGDRQIRIWSAGCATGAEAYTIAILLAEALGEEAFRERTKIYATDVDDDALRRARQAAYTEKEIADVPDELRERYFVPLDGHYTFRNGFRRAVIFGRNDLLQDPPISRVDLLVSRNTLMYFGQEAQDRILEQLLLRAPAARLPLLGKAEALHSRTSLFEPLDVKRRVFVKNHGTYVEPRMGAGFAVDRRPYRVRTRTRSSARARSSRPGSLRSSSTSTGASRRSTTRRARCSASRPPTSRSRSTTSRSRTGRSTYAR